MGIFDNLFGGGADYALPEIPKTKVGEAVEEAQKKPEPKLPAYQIGVTVDNRVTLTVGDSYYSSTLTMNNEGVDRIIRMLEAAKDQTQDTIEVEEEPK